MVAEDSVLNVFLPECVRTMFRKLFVQRYTPVYRCSNTVLNANFLFFNLLPLHCPNYMRNYRFFFLLFFEWQKWFFICHCCKSSIFLDLKERVHFLKRERECVNKLQKKKPKFGYLIVSFFSQFL